MPLILLAVLLTSVGALMTALFLCLRGQWRRGIRIVFRCGLCLAVYGAVLVGAAILPRESVLRTGVPYCDGDMCMSVESITRTVEQSRMSYRFGVRLFSLANHQPRSTKGATVYLADDRNRRFLPVSDPSAIPFDTDLQPGQSVNTSLSFTLPLNARGLVFSARMDRIQYASFIFGNGGDLLGRPRLKFRLPVDATNQ